MNLNLHSPTKLTEFARDFEDEEPETLFGRFVNKIQNVYNQSYNTVNEIPGGATQVAKSTFYDGTAPATISRDSSSSSLNSTNKPQPPNTLAVFNNSINEANSSSTTTTTEELSEASEKVDEMPAETAEGRTMANVVKRISNLMASKNSDLRNYKDTELQRFWMPDSKAKECYDCSQKFSTFRRKHHCRLCGQIFCSKCCNQVVPGKIIMCSGDLKVCNYCSKIVLSYLKSPNITVDLQADLQALQQDLSNKLDDNTEEAHANTLPTRSGLQRKVSVGYQEERFAAHQLNNLSNADRKNILQQSNSLITLHEEMQRLLPAQNCGSNLIEFLNIHNKSSNKVQAIAILSAMLAAGFLQPIVPDSEQFEFDETLHYKFAELQRQDIETMALSGENLSFTDILSDASSPQFDSTQTLKTIDTSLSFNSVTQDNELENSIRLTTTASKFLESYCDHEEQILTQMLRSFHLDVRWAKVLEPLCCRAANQFKPEYCTNELMDIRNYVNFKKVPGGKRTECTIVGGVVFSKNVAHKDMVTRVEHPRILLLQCPIVYERIEGKFVSISTVLLQEKEYLRNVTARIMSFQPNIVVVHKNVAGIAQDMLRSKGITLVLDVKLSVMERLARTLQCDIMTSIESNIAKPKLGICDAFYIRNYSYDDGGATSKTLMFFEKLSSPRGYTCLLRGGNNKELAKLKKVASFLVYARYNWRLEMSFLIDEFAEPLTPKPPIFDSKEQSPADENANTDENLNEDEPQLRSNISSCKRYFERKSEEKVLTITTENVSDFTDPLRSAEMGTVKILSDIPVVKLAVETPYDNRFRSALSSTVLSISPFLTFPLPYLETESGRKCPLRSLFPSELYYSTQLSASSPSGNNMNINLERLESTETLKVSEEPELKQPHPFLTLKITAPIDNREIQTLLAEFRAFGGRYPKKNKMFKYFKRRQSYQRPQKLNEDHLYKDALDLENHQRLPVHFCSFYYDTKSASSFCAPPTLLDMKFYGQQDIMLSQFLQRYCCRLSSICTLCDLPMLGHVRRYVHSMGCVQVFLNKDDSKPSSNTIYFTAKCTICNEMTPSVPLSETSKCLSFAKYLELRFHGHAYKKLSLSNSTPNDNSSSVAVGKCQHSLHRDYIHYFTYRGVGARFIYTPIDVWEIGLPTLILNLMGPESFDRYKILDEIKNFSLKGHELFTRIHERIADLATEDENSPLLANLKTTLSKNQFKFKQHIEIVQTLLIESKANFYDVCDAMLMSKRVLAEHIDNWGPRLNEIAVAQKLAAKQQQQQIQNIDAGHHVDPGTICTEDLRSDNSDASPASTSHIDNPRLPAFLTPENIIRPADDIPEDIENSTKSQAMSDKKTATDQSHASASTSSTDKKSIKKILIHLLPSTNQVNLLESPFLAQEHYTLPLGAFPILVHDHDLSSIIAYSLTSTEYQRSLLSNVNIGNNTNSSISNANVVPNASPSLRRKVQESPHDNDDQSKQTSSKTSSNNNNNNTNTNTNEEEKSKTKSNTAHIELIFQDSSAQFTCKFFFAKEFELLRAQTLRPPKLDKSLYKELEQSKKREELKVSKTASNCPEIEIVHKTNDTISDTCADKDENSQLQTEMEECRIHLARSLSSSVQWEARGGKSGSRFCKTSDDRFVLKEMNKLDISLFENFAPHYFEYISKCQQQKQPTLLAKIFGVFKVTIKKKDFFQEKSLLVMENLFYNCDIKSKFDLKGSERNRLVDPTNQHGDEIVLLDENLMQMSWSKPLYVLSHSKSILKETINRDSSFLEKHQVMDYSLLVGLDNKNSTLVLGIIDYIRTFTFDKKVESYIKQTGLLGGMGKLPTVISPERYKQRFIESMDRYFYTVPDRWEGLSKI